MAACASCAGGRSASCVRRGLHESLEPGLLVQPSVLVFLCACMFMFMERLYLPVYVVSSSRRAMVWSDKDAHENF